MSGKEINSENIEKRTEVLVGSNQNGGHKFRLTKKIGSGSFGDVYEAQDETTKEKVAVKMERRDSRHPQLLFESKLYRVLQGGVGVPVLR